MISINQYTIIKTGIYLVIFFNIFLMQYKRNIFDIHESITFLNFVKSIFMVFLFCLLKTIYFFRYLYLENEFLSRILMILQIVISYGFEILLITSWLRCFYMSGKIRLGYACILLWISSRFILGIPIFFLFLFITTICVALLWKHNKDKNFKRSIT